MSRRARCTGLTTTVSGSSETDLDGTHVEDLVTTGLLGPWGIALDVAAGKMYWTDYYAGKIQRADLDGNNVEDLVSGQPWKTFGIALDVGAGKMYWTGGGKIRAR